jgi:outer membrane protein assembly factor BamB
MGVSRTVVSLVVVVAFCTGSLADEWPQWMGPDRDNVWKEDGLLDSFPASGPKVVWRAPVAGGYSGPAVFGEYVIVTDYVTSENVMVANFEQKKFTGIERVLCLREATGKPLWKHEYPVKYGISYPAGPRCTPNVDEGKLFTLGAEGDLICFELATGAIVWSKNLRETYNTKTPFWGYSSHPLIDGDKLICLAGLEGCHMVALNKGTGEEIWRAESAPQQGYSPPTIIEAGGVRQLINFNPGSVNGLDPETGDSYWSIPYEADNGSVIMSPIRVGDLLYIAGYSKRNALLKLDMEKPDAELIWQDESRRGLSPVNVQPIAVGDTIYGFHQDGQMMAFELPSGKRLWKTAQPIGKRAVQTGTAFIVKEKNRYWMFSETGDLMIAKLDRDGYEELDRTHILEPTNNAFGRDVVWSMPAFAHRKMFVRNDQECVCVDLSADVSTEE